MGIQGERFIRPSAERVEDAALLSGGGRYIDDLGVRPGTLHAAIVRSPHAHADLLSVDKAAALSLPGVAAVITGADLVGVTAGLVPALRVSVDARAIAVDRVRYVGEPVAVVVAAGSLPRRGRLSISSNVRVPEPLPAVIDPESRRSTTARRDHPPGSLGSQSR